MRKYFYSTLLCLYFSNAFSQEKIGEELLQWVKNDLQAQSKKFIAADYKLRTENYFIALHQDSYALLDTLAKSMTEISDHVNKSEAAYSVLPSFKAAILRQRDADSILNLIRAWNAELQYTVNDLETVSNLMTREFYTSKGIYHIGRANLFSSLVPDLRDMRDNLPSRYGVSLQLQVDQNGNPNFFKSTTQAVNSNEMMAETVIYAASFYFPPYGSTIAAAAILAYNIFKGVSEYEKMKEQQEKINEAIDLIPSLLPTEESTYQDYRKIVAEIIDSFKPVDDSLHESLLNTQDVIKTVFAQSYARLKVSEEILTAEKTKYLQEEFNKQNPQVISSFNVPRLIQVFNDLTLFAREKDLLQVEASKKDFTVKGFRNLEEYSDATREFYTILKVMRTGYEYIPIWPYIDKKLAQEGKDTLGIRKMKKDFLARRDMVPPVLVTADRFYLNEVLDNADFLHASFDFAKTKGLENSFSAFSILNIKTKGNSLIKSSDQAEKFLKVSAAYTVIPQLLKADKKNITDKAIGNKDQDPPRNFVMIDGHVGICIGCPSPYYNQTGTPINHRDLFNTSYDGAYQKQVIVAEGKVAAMKTNIEDRVSMMKTTLASLDAILPGWKQKNTAAITSYNEKISGNISPAVATSYKKFFSDNQETLNQSRIEFDNFLSQGLGKESQSMMEAHLRMSQQIKCVLSKEYIRPNGQNVTGLEFRPDLGTNKYAAIIEHEKNKRQAEFAYVERRIKGNERYGVKDPVFDDIQFFYDLSHLSSSYLTNAERCLDTHNQLYAKNKKLAEELCSNYIEQARQIRAYALGYMPGYAYPQQYFIPRNLLYNEIRPGLEKFASCSIELGSDLEHSACNRFVGLALRDVYGVTEFLGEGADPGENGIYFLNTADMENFVTTSENWNLIGSGDDQDAIYNAGYFASQGHVVIALGQGHVTLILPSTYTYSPSWKEYVPKTVRFTINTEKRKPIYKYEALLSEQWTRKSKGKVKFYYRNLP